MLSLGAGGIVRIAIEPEELRDGGVVHAVEEEEFPSESCGREAHCPERVADVVLAIPERALAILPGFSPVNGGEPDEERALRKRGGQPCPDLGIELRASLEAVLLGCVVVDAGTFAEAAERREERVALGRVEVPAGGIDAKRPLGLVELLPRRQREGVAEEERDGLDRKRRRFHDVSDFVSGIKLPIRKRSPGLGERKTDKRGPGVAPERIRLRRPIHGARRRGVAVVVMLRSLVIGQHDFLGGQVDGHGARLQPVAGNRWRSRRSEVERQASQHREPPGALVATLHAAGGCGCRRRRRWPPRRARGATRR